MKNCGMCKNHIFRFTSLRACLKHAPLSVFLLMGSSAKLVLRYRISIAEPSAKNPVLGLLRRGEEKLTSEALAHIQG
jgi:hypothetical protein